jgi:hypothetical protein
MCARRYPAGEVPFTLRLRAEDEDDGRAVSFVAYVAAGGRR